MATTFQTTAKTDKTAYNAGDTVTVSITGGATGSTSTVTNMSETLTLTASDGSTTTLTVPSVPVTTTSTTALTVKISQITDDGGRTWTIAANGLSATAKA